MSRYPEEAGSKAGGTSAAAAPDREETNRLRRQVLAVIRATGQLGATADEVALALGRTPFATRPRCTELSKLRCIRDSGRRRRNASGRNAIVWEAAW